MNQIDYVLKAEKLSVAIVLNAMNFIEWIAGISSMRKYVLKTIIRCEKEKNIQNKEQLLKRDAKMQK